MFKKVIILILVLFCIIVIYNTGQFFYTGTQYGSKERSNAVKGTSAFVQETPTGMKNDNPNQPAAVPKPKPAKKPSTRSSEVKYNQLVTQIDEYTGKYQGTYGVYFISLTTGQKFGINENEQFVAASTTKVPINLYLFSKIAENKVQPDILLTYTEDCYEEGTGSIQYEDFGKEYSIRDLARLSIEESDNAAINMLSKYLGMEEIKKFMEGIVKHPVDLDDNLSNPKDMANYMKSVLDFNKKHKAEGDELLSYLENTEFNDRIPLYLPPDTIVAHKIGNQVQALHDIGIVFAQKSYIISIMTKDINEDEAPEVIANISKMVYDFEEKQ